MQALFGDKVPDGCPTDPLEKQRYLAAQAVTQLMLDNAIADHHTSDDNSDGDTTGDASATTTPHHAPTPARLSRTGPPEFVAVIDADAPGHHGPVAEFSIPVEIPARVLATLADTADIHAVVVRNGIVLYAPGCTVGYDRCKLHHIIWWINGGTTDLNNLLPVCSMHHTRIHNDGWIIELGPHRELTLRLPDGAIHTTAPPTRRTAA